MIVGRRDDDNWWHGERKERERQVPDSGERGLQWASHETRLATSCRPEPLWNVKQWLAPVEILTVGTSWCQSHDCRVCLISKLSFGGVSSQGITFCIGNWISHDHHQSASCSGEESTRHAGTFDSKNCTLIWLGWSHTVLALCRVKMRIVKCCVQKTFNSSITYFNKTIKRSQGRLAELVSKDISCHVNIRFGQVLLRLISIKWQPLSKCEKE